MSNGRVFEYLHAVVLAFLLSLHVDGHQHSYRVIDCFLLLWFVHIMNGRTTDYSEQQPRINLIYDLPVHVAVQHFVGCVCEPLLIMELCLWSLQSDIRLTALLVAVTGRA
jgi:hypothetical protein